MTLAAINLANIPLVKPSDLKPPLAKPSDFGPAAPAGGAPDGIPTARASASAEMAPRAALGPAGGPGGAKTPDLAAITRDAGADGVAAAKGDAADSMKSMAEMTAIQMKFQMQTGIMQLHKSMNETVAKAVRDVGKGVKDVAQ